MVDGHVGVGDVYSSPQEKRQSWKPVFLEAKPCYYIVMWCTMAQKTCSRKHILWRNICKLLPCHNSCRMTFVQLHLESLEEPHKEVVLSPYQVSQALIRKLASLVSRSLWSLTLYGPNNTDNHIFWHPGSFLASKCHWAGFIGMNGTNGS